MKQMPKTANFPNEIKFKLAKMLHAHTLRLSPREEIEGGRGPIMGRLKMSANIGQQTNNNNNSNIMNEIMLKTYFSSAPGASHSRFPFPFQQSKQKMWTNFVVPQNEGKAEENGENVGGLWKSPKGGCFPISKQ